MNRKKKYLIGLGILVILGLLVLLRGSGGKNQPESAEAAGPLKAMAATVQKGSISESVWVTGEVNALQSVDITPKISGRLRQMRRPDGAPIEEGVEVEEGQTVAWIEDDQYQAAVRSAEAALAVARAGRGLAEVNLAEAIREKERWDKLRQGGSGSEQQLDRAVTDLERARAELTAAEARIVQAEAALAQARVDLAETVIRAPFSGVVSIKHVDEGSFVGPATPLFQLSDISRVEITGGVADRHYPLLQIGRTRAAIEVDAYPEEVFSGEISRVRPELDRVTRTVAVTILADNPDRKLKPGMYARIRLVLREKNDIPVIADEAVLTGGGETRVYVVEEGIARSRKIRIGLEEGNLNEVLEGLEAGEEVVVRGHRRLREGLAVKVEEAGKQ